MAEPDVLPPAPSRARRAVVLAVGVAIAATALGLAVAQHRREVPILMYHRVGNDAGDLWTVSPETFRNQMQALKAGGYETVLPEDLAAHRRFGKSLPARPLMLTFDDGYLSTATEVEPVLRALGFRAIVFLPTARIGATPEQRLSMEGHECVTWSEVRALRARSTLAFGGHGHEHVRMDLLPDPEAEVAACVQAFVEQGGFRPDAFAYPFGAFGKPLVRALRGAGFATAVTCSERVARIGWPDKPMKLPRLWVRRGQPLPLPGFAGTPVDAPPPESGHP